MKTLALEFSSPQRSVAFQAHATAPIFEITDARPGRAMQPIALIESVLAQAQTTRAAVEHIVVGLGPGSYTGIRVALALAQGWQLATDLRVSGISSATSTAARAVGLGVTGPFHVVLDAQRGEVYLGAYESTGTTVRELQPLRIIPASELPARHQGGAVLVGPEITRWLPTGLPAAPTATHLLRLAQSLPAQVSAPPLEPIYLRTPTFVKAPPARPLPPDIIGGD